MNDKNHQILVVRLIKDFIKENLSLEFQQLRIGHLFYGQRAFPFGGRDVEIDSTNKIRFYPSPTDGLSIGLVLLIDETCSSFDIGIGELSQNDLGFFFEPILLNIVLLKDANPAHRLDGENYYIEIYEVESFGSLRRLRLTDIDKIKAIASTKIYDILLFNTDRISRL